MLSECICPLSQGEWNAKSVGHHSHLMCPLQGKEAAGTVSPSPRPRLLQCACGHLPYEYPLLLCLPLPVCLRAHGGLPAFSILVRVPHLPVALLPGVRRDSAGDHCSFFKCLLTTEPHPSSQVLGRTPGGGYLLLHLGVLLHGLAALSEAGLLDLSKAKHS